MDLTVQNVYGLLLRSRLLAVEDARKMYARWQDEARDNAANLARFASWMVANKYVTEYQASLLARGHADGFYLNDYKILDRLGKGRMAGVYRAQHELGQLVAIKVLPPSKAREPTMLARFQREARLALKLQHPNIVRAFQLGQAGQLHYLVMEFLEGATLEEALAARNRLPPQEAVRLVYQALQGLQHIHEQGLVHRDLKPANLMLVPAPSGASTLDCSVKILDIGLGRALYDEQVEHPDSGLTSEGVLLGTPDYMSPEQARDPRLTDIRGDIYSLGCVLYHLLTGQPPFPDTNIISQMIRHASETPRPLSDFNSAVPDGLEQIVGWMMAKEVTGRYPTPERAALALEVFLAAGAGVSSPVVDPSMSKYLDWLEGKTTGDPADEESPPTLLLPASKPKSEPVLQAKKAGSEKSGRSSAKLDRPREETRAKKKPPPPPVSPEGATAPYLEAAVDVELVTLPPTAPRRPRRAATTLTRRDLVMYFLGVGSTLVAYAVGRGLAALFGRPRSQPED